MDSFINIVSMNRKERFRQVIEYFTETMPQAETELDHTDPYELLVAVILSAQCTDRRVNLITPEFFRRYPDAYALAEAGQEEIFGLIRSCSYPNSKAGYLSGMARMLVERFGGEVPGNREELQMLPGVGRKTANVVLSVAFRKPAMAVDTHVFRVAARIGLTTGAKNPYETEMQLVKNIPEEKIPLAHHWLILHGRYICTARNPACTDCGIRHLCRYVEKKENK